MRPQPKRIEIKGAGDHAAHRGGQRGALLYDAGYAHRDRRAGRRRPKMWSIRCAASAVWNTQPSSRNSRTEACGSACAPSGWVTSRRSRKKFGGGGHIKAAEQRCGCRSPRLCSSWRRHCLRASKAAACLKGNKTQNMKRRNHQYQ